MGIGRGRIVENEMNEIPDVVRDMVRWIDAGQSRSRVRVDGPA